jgi:hypothetical protein
MNPNLGGYLRDPRQERLIVARRLEQINQIALDAEPGFVDVLDIDQKAVRAMPVEKPLLW